MPEIRYPLYTIVRITATFRLVATGRTFDPDAVTVTILKPDRTEVNDVPTGAAGVYSFDVYTDQPGDWHYRFDGSGPNAIGGPGVFSVATRWAT